MAQADNPNTTKPPDLLVGFIAAALCGAIAAVPLMLAARTIGPLT
jgi:hypothetical protein